MIFLSSFSAILNENIDIAHLNQVLPEDIRLFAVSKVNKAFDPKNKCTGRTYTYTIPTVAFANHDDPHEMETYRVPSEKIEQLNTALRMFMGERRFHNFTTRDEYVNLAQKRLINSFECETPFVGKDEVQFAVIRVQAETFMINQINQMIGLTVAVLRGLTPTETINLAFTDVRIGMPIAPGLGLVLEYVDYDRYNERYTGDGIHDSLSWKEEEPEIQRFIDTFIVPKIIETEIKERSIVNWLETLTSHSFEVQTD